jgi:hypothetical protein
MAALVALERSPATTNKAWLEQPAISGFVKVFRYFGHCIWSVSFLASGCQHISVLLNEPLALFAAK